MPSDAIAAPVFEPSPRPPEGHVLWDPDPKKLGAKVDWSQWYLTDEDDMGEGGEQEHIIWILKQILTQLAEEREWEDVHIGADQFFAWVEREPLVRVSPDVYLLDGKPKRPLPASWQTWREDHKPPRLAVEIVSEESWKKDYQQNPHKYAQLGAGELIIFDPVAATAEVKGKDRFALQVFRREDDGRFVRVERGDGPVFSRELGAWFVAHIEGQAATLLVSRDAAGRQLVSTVEQARDEAKRREAEERRLRQEAEEKLQAALNELERLKAGG